MGVITVRLPDDTHQRVRELASSRKTSLNKLYEEFTVMALSEFDAEQCFKALARKGDGKRGMELLEKLQIHYGDRPDKD